MFPVIVVSIIICSLIVNNNWIFPQDYCSLSYSCMAMHRADLIVNHFFHVIRLHEFQEYYLKNNNVTLYLYGTSFIILTKNNLNNSWNFCKGSNVNNNALQIFSRWEISRIIKKYDFFIRREKTCNGKLIDIVTANTIVGGWETYWE